MNRKEYKDIFADGLLNGIFLGALVGLLLAGILEKL
tara:strand:- start:14 stop:121 length:108 start_codon:yes stop_codon:yes gene_type:complete